MGFALILPLMMTEAPNSQYPAAGNPSNTTEINTTKKMLFLKKLISGKALPEFIIVAALLLISSGVILLADIDLALLDKVFTHEQRWIYRDIEPWRFLYDYGALPGVIIGIGGACVFLLSFLFSGLRPCRKKALFLMLVLILGTGGSVTALKSFTDRPRPRHVETFNGDRKFAPIFPVGAGPGNSFPSGHAAIAFYVISPFFLYRDRRRGVALLFLIGGLTYGAFMGAARMAQGGHFLSDIIWSGGLVYLAGWFFYHILNISEEDKAWGPEPGG